MSWFCQTLLHNKTPEPLRLQGFAGISALGELRRTAGRFEAILLALLHPRVAGEEAGLLQDGAVVVAGQQQGAGDAVAQSAW